MMMMMMKHAMNAILLCALLAASAPGDEGTPRISEPSEEPKLRFYSYLPDVPHGDATYDTILVRTPIRGIRSSAEKNMQF
jgi:hypothetical protein